MRCAPLHGNTELRLFPTLLVTFSTRNGSHEPLSWQIDLHTWCRTSYLASPHHFSSLHDGKSSCCTNSCSASCSSQAHPEPTRSHHLHNVYRLYHFYLMTAIAKFPTFSRFGTRAEHSTMSRWLKCVHHRDRKSSRMSARHLKALKDERKPSTCAADVLYPRFSVCYMAPSSAPIPS
jgi:hypothetical protein